MGTGELNAGGNLKGGLAHHPGRGEGGGRSRNMKTLYSHSASLHLGV